MNGNFNNPIEIIIDNRKDEHKCFYLFDRQISPLTNTGVTFGTNHCGFVITVLYDEKTTKYNYTTKNRLLGIKQLYDVENEIIYGVRISEIGRDGAIHTLDLDGNLFSELKNTLKK